MDLKDFVKSSLHQIAEGIIEANEALSDTNAIVNPPDITVYSETSQAYGRTKSTDSTQPASESRVVEKVEFDVAVTVEDGTAKDTGIKVSIMSVGLGAGRKSKTKSGSESRIRFAVPMIFPTTKST